MNLLMLGPCIDAEYNLKHMACMALIASLPKHGSLCQKPSLLAKAETDVDVKVTDGVNTFLSLILILTQAWWYRL
jgi:hypothetical protein